MSVVDQVTKDLVLQELLSCEWTEHGGPVYTCHGCGHAWTFQKIHAPKCRVDAALAALGLATLEAREKARRKMVDDDFDERWPRLKRQKAEGGAR